MIDLDPAVLDDGLAASLVAEFDRLERLAAAGKALAARRVADSNRWVSDGARSAAHWVADRTGVAVGSAVSTLETAERLDRLPGTDTAFRAGRLSGRR